ncbi:glutathione S- transferase, nitrogen catabolite repression regulator [Elasticomyces elasticus]|nr:glutathione S- transferase, nitrogen catabolite repression regulator [Elasticomyces elasticus]
MAQNGPNPQKVGIILEELRLPFSVQTIEQEAQQSADERDVQASAAPPVKDKNTGMIVLEDPNSKVLLWESLAIVEYLVQTYDKEQELHYAPNTQNWWMCQQWLAYQMGAQSPFFSLKAYFSNQHEDKVPSVIGRFSDDVIRIAAIMEHYLEKGGKGYLVGDKCTYADLVFVPWNNKIGELTCT